MIDALDWIEVIKEKIFTFIQNMISLWILVYIHGNRGSEALQVVNNLLQLSYLFLKECHIDVSDRQNQI